MARQLAMPVSGSEKAQDPSKFSDQKVERGRLGRIFGWQRLYLGGSVATGVGEEGEDRRSLDFCLIRGNAGGFNERVQGR